MTSSMIHTGMFQAGATPLSRRYHNATTSIVNSNSPMQSTPRQVCDGGPMSSVQTMSSGYTIMGQNTRSSSSNYFTNYNQPPVVVPSIMSGNRYLSINGGTASHKQSITNYQSREGFQSKLPYQMSQSTTTLVGEAQVISERIVEHEVRVPKKVVREDIVEKVIVVPEKVLHEELVEDVQLIREKIIEVAKPVIRERIVEVPEIEYIDKIVEIPEIIYQEKIREVPTIEFQERIIEVPKIITQERVVEVPEIEYREIPYEKFVEVPEIHEQIVVKQIPVPQYVDKPVPEYVNTEIEQEIFRNIPVPIESVTTIDLKVPQLRPRYTRQDVPLYVPRFIEIAMPAELMDASAIMEAERYAQRVAVIASQSAASLCEIERIAGTLKNLDGHYSDMLLRAGKDSAVHVANAWKQGRFEMIQMNVNSTLTESVEIKQRSAVFQKADSAARMNSFCFEGTPGNLVDNERIECVQTRELAKEDSFLENDADVLEEKPVAERIISSTNITTVTKVVELEVMEDDFSDKASIQSEDENKGKDSESTKNLKFEEAINATILSKKESNVKVDFGEKPDMKDEESETNSKHDEEDATCQ